MASRITISYREVRDWPGKPASWRKDPPFKGTPLLARLAGNGAGPNDVLRNINYARDAFRRARRNAHPDRGGTHEQFLDVTKAAAALSGYFGERIDG